MTPLEFERRVQECWDARRDPAADAELCAWLLERPHVLEEFARRRALVAALGSVSLGSVSLGSVSLGSGDTRRRLTPAVLLVTASAVACVLLWFRGDAGGAHRTGRVLAATLESIPPTGTCTATWREHEVLFATPEGRLEIVQQRSERR